MDIQREGAGRRKTIRRISLTVAGVVLCSGITWAVLRMQSPAPAVDRGPLWIDTVKRGEMVREVRGIGALVPEEVLWVPSTTEGRVDKIMIRPGAHVKKDTLLMVLSNPQLENEVLDALYQLKSAEAGLTDIKVRLESAKLQQVASTAQLKSDYSLAQIQSEKDDALAKLGLTAEINAKISRAKVEELSGRYKIEQKRLDISDESIQAQIAAQKVQIDKLRALHRLKQSQMDALKVRAGTEGVLQQVPVEVGQKLAAGTILAKVSQPSKLKAELKVAETQAKDISVGQPVAIDTHNGIIAGRVSRIDPAAVAGNVMVDVRLDGALPAGARPDLSVDGTIEIERLRNIAYMGRPVYAQPNTGASLFKVDPDGKGATKVQVRLGRISVNTIEVVEGLKPGDQVILSDMNLHEAHPRIRFN